LNVGVLDNLNGTSSELLEYLNADMHTLVDHGRPCFAHFLNAMMDELAGRAPVLGG